MPGKRGSLEERLWPKIARCNSDECWLWLACTNGHGYGTIGRGGVSGGNAMAHRVVYELLVGPIPDGLDLDHLCRNRRCVNPAHLEPVTRRENLLRGATLPALQSALTHCVAGHPFDDANTYHWRNQRHCRTCRRDRMRDYYRQRKIPVRGEGPSTTRCDESTTPHTAS